MANVIIDPYSKSLEHRFVLIKTPKKTKKRYPEGCVYIVESEEEAKAGLDLSKNMHPAVVYGPSSSSESQRIYYLVKWL